MADRITKAHVRNAFLVLARGLGDPPGLHLEINSPGDGMTRYQIADGTGRNIGHSCTGAQEAYYLIRGMCDILDAQDRLARQQKAAYPTETAAA